MPRIGLKKYGEEIRQTIQKGDIDQAIAHCRHILSYYPMYLPAYRLLGNACMEKGDYSYATHFYQSVLSADPEDAHAWSRLSILTEDLGELEQATWLMERAFEVNPGNAEIRGLLSQLYRRRDGVDRPRLKLTPGALARLYAKGGFYQRAVDEINKILATSGLATLYIAYLEVALAEALWHTENMLAMADNIAQRLLTKLPNCLKANLIAGQIRWAAGKRQEAQQFLKTALALDPEGYIAYQMFGEHSPIPVTDIEIPYLEREAQAAFIARPEPEAQEDLSWLEQIGEIAQKTPGLQPVKEETSPTVPEWLETWPSTSGQAVDSSKRKPRQPEPEEPATPAWLRELQTREKEPAIPEWLRDIQQASVETPPPPAEWLAELGEKPVQAETVGERAEAETEQETIPDWLNELAETEPAAKVESAAEIETGNVAETELPDWLAELAIPEETEIVPEEETEAELPDWLRELQPEAEPPVAEAPLAAEPEALETAELPDWLRELQPTARTPETAEFLERPAEPGPQAQVAEPRPVVSQEPELEMPTWLTETGHEVPAWLREPEEAEQETVIESVQPGLAQVQLPEPVEGMPNWLVELEAEIAKKAAPVHKIKPSEPEMPTTARPQVAPMPAVKLPEPVEGMPDWLVELEAEIAGTSLIRPEAEIAVEPPLAEPPVAGAQLAAEPEGLETVELPDWLRELKPEAEIAVEPPIELVENQAGTETEIPDWLVQLEQEPIVDLRTDTLQATEEAEEPVWLAELQTQEQQTSDQITVEEMPEWLEELHRAEPQVEQPTAPEIVAPSAKAPQLETAVPPSEAARPIAKPAIRRFKKAEPQPTAVDDYQSRLAQAHSCLRDDNPDAAAKIYATLIATTTSLNELIGDLENAVQSYPDNPALYQQLGDAYMRADRCAAALEAYKKALSFLG